MGSETIVEAQHVEKLWARSHAVPSDWGPTTHVAMYVLCIAMPICHGAVDVLCS